MWVWSGFVLSLGLALVALWRSRTSARTYYEGDVYGMDRSAHRKYALGFTVAAVAFSAGLVWPGILSRDPAPTWLPLGLLCSVTLSGIIYGSGFLRGATGEDE